MRRDLLLVVAYVAGFGVVTWALAAQSPLVDVDLAVRQWAEAHRPDPADAVARVLNRLGQGGALLGICLLLAGWLALRRRPEVGWGRALRPVLYVVLAAAVVYLTVNPTKHLTERGAPSSTLPPEQTVRLTGPLPAGEYDLAYPSGHAVNIIVWYGIIVLLATLLRQAYGRPGPPPALRYGLRVVPVVLVVGAQTYLAFHWLSDSLAGLALGLAIDRGLHLARSAVRLTPD